MKEQVLSKERRKQIWDAIHRRIYYGHYTAMPETLPLQQRKDDKDA